MEKDSMEKDLMEATAKLLCRTILCAGVLPGAYWWWVQRGVRLGFVWQLSHFTCPSRWPLTLHCRHIPWYVILYVIWFNSLLEDPRYHRPRLMGGHGLTAAAQAQLCMAHRPACAQHGGYCWGVMWKSCNVTNSTSTQHNIAIILEGVDVINICLFVWEIYQTCCKS